MIVESLALGWFAGIASRRYCVCMPDLGVRLANMNPEERAATIERGAQALINHQCVVLPTDTLYGLFTRADEQGAALLDEITGHPEVLDDPRMTLHLADLDQIIEHLVLDAPTTRRLVTTLLPGPTRFVIEQPSEAIDRLCEALSIPRSIIDDGRHIAIRIPDHPTCRQVLRVSGVACIARRLGAAEWAIGEDPGTDLSTLPQGASETNVPFPALVVDDGQTLHQKHSTTVRLSLDGRIDVSASGVVSEREVLSKLERRILFVCTGNTCRSPMAEVIARDLVQKQPPSGITTIVQSAGVAAGSGMSATREAVDVVKSMGMDLSGHQSRPITLEMIDQAEIIYTMTPTHAQAVMTMAPNSVHKVFVLDEQEGVPDPIGQGIEVYQHTADRLRELIQRRFEEINA